jgi:hypothetical protein
MLNTGVFIIQILQRVLRKTHLHIQDIRMQTFIRVYVILETIYTTHVRTHKSTDVVILFASKSAVVFLQSHLKQN